jgi:putative nucleotidyltransferase with HDIG domain
MSSPFPWDPVEPSHDAQKLALKKHVDSMPAFSPATVKVVSLASRLNTSPAEIVAAIRLDPVLTGKVLQLVNSAYFELAQRVTSLNRAVVYLGINTIKNLALSTAVMQAFESKNNTLANLIRPAWRHSLATAVSAKLLAVASGADPKQLEEYFIAGLLHDVGKIILMQAFHETLPHDGKLSVAAERERYGIDHCQLGADTLRRWKFSDDLVQAVGTFYNPAPTNRMANFIHLANAMTYRLDLNGPEGGGDFTILPGAYAAIGLTEEKCLFGLAPAEDQIKKAEVFLNIASSSERVVETE